MSNFTRQELENLIDLVEIKLICMLESGSHEQKVLSSLKSAREKLMNQAVDRRDVRVSPFNESLLSAIH